MKILVLNSGSSSQKACVYEIGDTLPDHPPACLWEGKVEFGEGKATVIVKNRDGAVRKEEIQNSSREQVVKHLLGTLADGGVVGVATTEEIDAVGHRVVHGGPHFAEPVIITREVQGAIRDVAALAPLHTRAEVEGMDIIATIFGAVPQVAVFDTGFHRTMPPAAATYPGPYEWYENGIRRYGFHGINHQYCAGQAAQMLNLRSPGRDARPLKLVTCHLGNGCSVAAIDGGRSVDTTMGFTPLEGLMMGTRSGSVDPGILTFLMRNRNLDGEKLDRVLNNESGLLGISGLSSDMRDILAGIQKGHQRAQLAFDIFVHRLRAAIGSMAAVLDGIDALVFTAGVGENSPDVRAATCSKLEFLGVRLESQKNANPKLDADISSADSRVRVLVIRAEEDWAIATECWRLVRATVNS